jgi:hypothetical protein
MGSIGGPRAALRGLVYSATRRLHRFLRERPQERSAILTIGHSNHAIEAFLELLRRHGVEVVVDVRSQPTSTYAPHFDRSSLKRWAAEAGWEYVFLGDELGGRPRGGEFYGADGRVDYARVARSTPFRRGVERLVDLAAHSRVAILCAEEDPLHCHRRRLVGRVLLDRGFGLEHLRGDGRVESETAVAFRSDAARQDSQLSLFNGDEDVQWTSTRSASRRRRRPSSSGR